MSLEITGRYWKRGQKKKKKKKMDSGQSIETNAAISRIWIVIVGNDSDRSVITALRVEKRTGRGVGN